MAITNKKILLILFISGFLLYGNTIFNKYALDDAIVITKNQFTKKGIKGIPKILSTEFFTGFFGKKKNLVSGGRYRPLSVVTFAMEYELFGENPHISHFINILLYITTGFLLYIVLSLLFASPPTPKTFFNLPLTISILATLLWFFHPIHTEVVANIKGRDEILSLLFALLSMYYYIKYFKDGKMYYLFISSISLFLGLLSKETAITFLFLIPFSVWLFNIQSDIRKQIIPFIILFLFTLVYLIIRIKIVGLPTSNIPAELMNNPFLHSTVSQKFATIFFTFLIYFKLLFFPHPLTYDYYPYHIHLTDFSNPLVIFSIIINLGLIILALYLLKKNKIISFAIIFFYTTFFLVSNLLFPVGVFMNERFMFTPSIGFAIILAYFLLKIKNEKVTKGILLTIFLLSTIKTISRNKDWYNDFTLFTHDVKTSYDSAKSNTSAGGVLIDSAKNEPNFDIRKQMFTQSKRYLKRAISIHPKYIDALILLGNAYYEDNRQIDSTWIYYKKILKINPLYDKVYNNMQIMFNYDKDTFNIDSKIKIAKELEQMKYVPAKEKSFFIGKAGNFYGRFKNKLDSSLYYLTKAYKYDTTNTLLYKDLGVVYGLLGNVEKSVFFTKKAIVANPSDVALYYNLGVTYYQAAIKAQKEGNNQLAQKYMIEAKKYFEIHKQKTGR